MDMSENPAGQLAPGASGSSPLTQGLPVPSSHVASRGPGAGAEERGQRRAAPEPERAGLEPSSHAGSLPSAHESVPPRLATAAEPSSQLASDAPLALAGAVPAAAGVLAAPWRRWSRLATCRRRTPGRCDEHAPAPCRAWVAHGALAPAAIAGNASSESASARSVRRWGKPVFSGIPGEGGGCSGRRWVPGADANSCSVRGGL
jgi:hypothetical protein